MTVVALLADPPRAEGVLSDLVDAEVCTAEEATDLYGAMVQDAAVGVIRSGGELLVNYPPAEDLTRSGAADTDVPGAGDGSIQPEDELRELLGAVIEDVDDVRFEVQVGSTESARVGNAVTHLLDAEDADSAAVLRPTAPFVDRTVVDATAMKLRRDEVVLGPAPGGRLYYAGFTEPVDFEDALAEPAVETLAQRAAEADLGLAFEAMQPVLERPDDLATVLPLLRARRRSDLPVPAATAAALDRIGLDVSASLG